MCATLQGDSGQYRALWLVCYQRRVQSQALGMQDGGDAVSGPVFILRQRRARPWGRAGQGRAVCLSCCSSARLTPSGSTPCPDLSMSP